MRSAMLCVSKRHFLNISLVKLRKRSNSKSVEAELDGPTSTLFTPTLHVTLHPCYFPARYSREGEAPPQLLGGTLMVRVAEPTLNVDTATERILRQS